MRFYDELKALIMYGKGVGVGEPIAMIFGVQCWQNACVDLVRLQLIRWVAWSMQMFVD